LAADSEARVGFTNPNIHFQQNLAATGNLKGRKDKEDSGEERQSRRAKLFYHDASDCVIE